MSANSFASPAGEAYIAKRDSEANLPEIDEASLTAAKVECREGADVLVGNLPCDQFKKATEKIVRGFFKKVSLASKKGFAIDWLGQGKEQGAYACNALEGEGLGGDDSKNSAGKNCGKFCVIKTESGFDGVTVSVSDRGGSACRREYGFYFGLYLQVLNKNKVDVLNEFKAGSVHLVDFDGVKPSAPYARDALRLQIGANRGVEEMVQKYGKDTVKSMKCEGPKKDDTFGKNFNAGNLSQCHMLLAQMTVPKQWASFLGFEIYMRAKKFMVQNIKRQDEWFNDAKNTVGNKCEDEVCGITCSDAKRTREVNSCYQREMPKYMRDKMKGMNIETPGDRLETTFNKSSSFFLFGFLLRRRPRKRKFVKKAMKTLALIGFILGVAMMSIGCGCNKPNLDCQPCKGPGLQLEGATKGCAFKLCMSARFACAISKEQAIGTDDVADAEESYCMMNMYNRPEEIGDDFFKGATTPTNLTPDSIVTFEDLKAAYAGSNPPISDTDLRKKHNDKTFALMQKLLASGSASTTYGELVNHDSTSDDSVNAYSTVGSQIDNSGIPLITLKTARHYCSQALGGVPLANWHSDYLPDDDHATDALVPGDINPGYFKDTLKVEFDKENGGQSPACAAGDAAPPLPGSQPQGNLDSGAASLGAARSLEGNTGLAATDTGPKKEIKAGGNRNSSAATAEQRPGATKNGNGSAGTGGTSTNAGSPAAGPKMRPFAANEGGGGSGAAGGGGGGGATGGEGLADTASTQVKTGNEGFESAGQGGSGKSGPPAGFGGFGGGAEAGAGVTNTSFGNGANVLAGTGDLESYLEKNGKFSLFEIVNKRMDKWGNEINTETATGAFKKLGQ